MKKTIACLLLLQVFFISCKKDPIVSGNIITRTPSNLSSSAATLNGEILNYNNGQIIKCGFVWSELPSPVVGVATVINIAVTSCPMSLSFPVLQLQLGHTYYYRTFVLTVAGVKYGNEVSFTTLSMQWLQAGTFPGTSRVNAATFSIGNKAYICTGSGSSVNNTTPEYSDVWEYDATTTGWTRKADFPGGIRTGAAGFAINGKGYVVGGTCNCNDCWQYDPGSDTWNRKANFPATGVYYTSNFTIGNKAYIGTGSNAMQLLNTLWEYDTSTDQWTQKANYPGTAVDAGVGFAINNKGYFATGNQSLGESRSLWQYDPGSDTWTQKKDYPEQTYFSLAFTINNKAYVGPGTGSDQFYCYDPATNEWTNTGNLQGGRGAGSAWVINNTAYIALGMSGTNYPAEVLKFTPSN